MLAWTKANIVGASFVFTDKGAFDDTSVMGSIGGQLLLPFRVVSNRPSGRIAIVILPR